MKFSTHLSVFALCAIGALFADGVSIGSVSQITVAPTATVSRSTIDAAPTPVGKRANVTPPTGFTISSMSITGTGCSAGSAFFLLSADKSAVTIAFSPFSVEVGPGISTVNNRNNCAATFGIIVPAGFSLGIASVDFHGYFQLDNAVTASLNSTYSFPRQSLQATAGSTIKGPISDSDSTYRGAFNLGTTVLSPCGSTTTLNINTDIQVSNSANPAGFGFIMDDSTSGIFTQTFNFNWFTC